MLMFNTGPEHGEATSTFTFEGERLYHASLAAAEYRTLLDRGHFEVIYMSRTTSKVVAGRVGCAGASGPVELIFSGRTRGNRSDR